MKRSFSIVPLSLILILLNIGCKNSTGPSPEAELETFQLTNSEGSGNESDPYLLTVVLDEAVESEVKTFPNDFETNFSFEFLKMDNGVLTPLSETDEARVVFTENNSDSLLSIKGIRLGKQYLRFGQEEQYKYALITIEEPEYDYSNSLKVLAVGNSFSQDATEYLWEIANNYGIQEVVIGNMYIGGMDLEGHWSNAESKALNYTYYRKTTGDWDIQKKVTLNYGLLDQDWDVITLQQVSGKSGRPETYNPYLEQLISYIQDIEKDKRPRIVWHMTWAYQQDSPHNDFSYYDSDQMTMYEHIVDAVQSTIETNDDISFVIPVGTAIQNIRTSFMGDHLTRDGHHLSTGRGRYTAGLTWFKTITEFSIEDITYRPQSVSELELQAIKESVNNTFETSYEVTESTFKEGETVNLDHHKLVDLTYTSGYWYPSNNRITASAGNSKYFVASEQRLSRSQLPVGSILKIEDGYKYRNVYYTNTSGSTADNTRSGNITKEYITIDESWWGNYNYVGFNISKQSGADISNEVDSVAVKLSVYATENAVGL